MDKLVLQELIKDYIYTRASLDKDPDNASLLLKAAELSFRTGLYRTAAELCSRCKVGEPGNEMAVDLAEKARKIPDSIAENYCVIAADRTGFVLVADRAANTLKKLSAEGELVWSVDKEGFEDDALYNPDSLAVSCAGDIYIGSSILSRIQVFSDNGAFRRAFPSPKKFGARIQISSLACDKFGNLWVMDSLSGLLRLLNPEGDELVTMPCRGRK